MTTPICGWCFDGLCAGDGSDCSFAAMPFACACPCYKELKMTLLTRDAILTTNDLVTEDVECPEWGGTVRVRTLTGAERDKYETTMANPKADRTNIRASLAATTIVGEDGNPVFTSKDIAKLGRKSAKALDRIFDVAARLAGITADEVEQKAKEDERDEDFDAEPDEPSTTA